MYSGIRKRLIKSTVFPDFHRWLTKEIKSFTTDLYLIRSSMYNDLEDLTMMFQKINREANINVLNELSRL